MQASNINIIQNHPAEEGRVVQVQNLSVNDGEGIRTVIFLAGCPLRCKWCSNPESWLLRPLSACNTELCTRCGACADACPAGLLRHGPLPDFGACTGCGACLNACPVNARTLTNSTMSVDRLDALVRRQLVFFRESGGGVTFSGGEATMQLSFLRSLARKFSALGVNLALETCGDFLWGEAIDVLDMMDHVFFDLKAVDPDLHHSLTGGGNARILDNLLRLGARQRPDFRLTVRVPLVPGANDAEDALRSSAAFMAANLPGTAVEVLPYHCLGHHKFAALNMTHCTKEYSVPVVSDLNRAKAVFQAAGVPLTEYR